MKKFGSFHIEIDVINCFGSTETELFKWTVIEFMLIMESNITWWSAHFTNGSNSKCLLPLPKKEVLTLLEVACLSLCYQE